MTKMIKKLVTIKLAAEILGLSREQLRNWDRTGKLKAGRDKNNNYRLYDISRLEKFAEKNRLRKNQRIRLVDN